MAPFFAHYFKCFTKSLKRFVALLTAVIYVLGDHSVLLHAARAPEIAIHSPLHLHTFKIPSRIGSVEKIIHSDTQKTIFLIQDAHSVPEAQKNIAKILQYLSWAHGVSAAGLEGASGELDPTVFKAYPEKKRLQALLSEHLSKGEIPGSILALLSREGRNARYLGVEDWPLYEEAIGLYLEALKQQSKILPILEADHIKLEEEKKKIYSERLLEFDSTLRAFYADPAHLQKLLLQLSEFRVQPVPASISKLLAEMHKEQAGPDVDQRPDALRHSQEREKRLRSIHGGKFFEDLQAYTDLIKESLFRNDLERKLDAKSRELALITKLAKLELTWDEWKEIRDPGSMIQDPEFGIPDLASSIAFYRNSEKRDGAFFENLTKKMSSAQDRIAFIGGGFHIPTLSAKFHQAGFNVVVLQPKISALPEQNVYQEHMRGNVSWKKDLIQKDGSVRLYDSFLNHFKQSLLDSSSESSGILQKAWHDEIIRELAAKGKIERAGEYLRQVSGQSSNAPVFPWRKRFERFASGLRLLRAENEITEQNIFNLLNAHVIAALGSPSLTVDTISNSDEWILA